MQQINKANIIRNNYGVSERVDCLAKSNAFISLKDDKPKFFFKSKMLFNQSCKKQNWEN